MATLISSFFTQFKEIFLKKIIAFLDYSTVSPFCIQ